MVLGWVGQKWVRVRHPPIQPPTPHHITPPRLHNQPKPTDPKLTGGTRCQQLTDNFAPAARAALVAECHDAVDGLVLGAVRQHQHPAGVVRLGVWLLGCWVWGLVGQSGAMAFATGFLVG